MMVVVKDSNGAELKDGDSVTLIKDLKVKGLSRRPETRRFDQKYPTHG